MKINKTMVDETLTVALEGRLDTATSPELDAEFENLDGVKKLIIDMAALSYISSAGLRVLLRAQKKMKKQGTMEIHHVNDLINEIFTVTGFDKFLTIVQ